MLPGAILATWVYTRLARRFSKEAIFYIVITGFISYFLLFTFCLHPNSDVLHLDRFGDWLGLHMPAGFKGMISMVRNWTFTTFYIMSELWAPVVLGMLFWGFVNDHTEVSQAKRTYGILNQGSNLAPILGGGLGILCANTFSGSFSTSSEEVWKHTLTNITLALTVLGIASMALFYWINRKVVNSQKPFQKNDSVEERGTAKLSIRESIRYIAKSKYLLCLALIF